MSQQTLTSTVLTAVLVAVACAVLVSAYPSVFPTGTTIYQPDEAYSSFILISDHALLGNHPSAAVRAQSTVPDDIRLIDMNGNVVHSWTVAPTFNKRSRLLPNGHLLYGSSRLRALELLHRHYGRGGRRGLGARRTIDFEIEPSSSL